MSCAASRVFGQSSGARFAVCAALSRFGSADGSAFGPAEIQAPASLAPGHAQCCGASGSACAARTVATGRRLGARVRRHSRVAKWLAKQAQHRACSQSRSVIATSCALRERSARMRGMSAARAQRQAKPPAMGSAARVPAKQLRPNPSIERTNNGGRVCAAPAAVCAPLFAAHVER
jgi:hypothetical protein